jgi:hypothetical protein
LHQILFCCRNLKIQFLDSNILGINSYADSDRLDSSLYISVWDKGGGEEFRDRVRVMVFSTSFNNISELSWRSVLLVEETGVPGENHWGEEYTMGTHSYP